MAASRILSQESKKIDGLISFKKVKLKLYVKFIDCFETAQEMMAVEYLRNYLKEDPRIEQLILTFDTGELKDSSDSEEASANNLLSNELSPLYRYKIFISYLLIALSNASKLKSISFYFAKPQQVRYLGHLWLDYKKIFLQDSRFKLDIGMLDLLFAANRKYVTDIYQLIQSETIPLADIIKWPFRESDQCIADSVFLNALAAMKKVHYVIVNVSQYKTYRRILEKANKRFIIDGSTGPITLTTELLDNIVASKFTLYGKVTLHFAPSLKASKEVAEAFWKIVNVNNLLRSLTLQTHNFKLATKFINALAITKAKIDNIMLVLTVDSKKALSQADNCYRDAFKNLLKTHDCLSNLELRLKVSIPKEEDVERKVAENPEQLDVKKIEKHIVASLKTLTQESMTVREKLLFPEGFPIIVKISRDRTCQAQVEIRIQQAHRSHAASQAQLFSSSATVVLSALRADANLLRRSVIKQARIVPTIACMLGTDLPEDSRQLFKFLDTRYATNIATEVKYPSASLEMRLR